MAKNWSIGQERCIEEYFLDFWKPAERLYIALRAPCREKAENSIKKHAGTNNWELFQLMFCS
jgi:hypothetical protein